MITKPAALPAGPFVLTLAVTLTGIGNRQFWRDEHATWWASTLPLRDLRRLIEVVDVVLLPYYLLLHGWARVFGTSEVALRVPSAIFMAVAAALLTLLGRRLFDAPTGLLAGLLFALVPATSRYGAEARPYAMVLVFTLAATLLLLRAIERPSARRWSAYALAVIGIGLSHLVALTVLAAHLVFAATAPQRRRALTGWLAAVLPALLLLAPLAVFARGQDGQIGWIADPTWTRVRGFPGEVFGGTPVAALILAPAVLGLALAARNQARWTAAALFTWVFVPPALALATFDQLGLFYHRYFLFAVPGAVLAAAWAVRRAGRNPRGLIAVGAVAALALGVAGLPHQRFVRSDALENEFGFAAAARHVHAGAQPSDRIAYVGHTRLYRGFTYEFSRLDGPDPAEAYSTGDPARPWWFGHTWPDDPGTSLDGVPRLWLVVADPKGKPFRQVPPKVRTLLGERYTVTATESFHRLQVTLLTAKKPA